ncbi:MAG: YHS domain-containing protein [Candidatus Sumerlaeia bacterium]|nr:YHS domain-containing protein [Candidatus Sumerlaeia bacterium]
MPLRRHPLIAALSATALFAGAGFAQETQPATGEPASPAASAPASEETTLLNAICPVMGGPVNPDITVQYEGKTIRFCCESCPQMFLQDPERYLDRLPQFGDSEDATPPTPEAEDHSGHDHSHGADESRRVHRGYHGIPLHR